MYEAEQTRQQAPDRIQQSGASLGSIRGNTVGPQHQPQLDAVTERLRLCVGDMQGAVHELEKRLESVLNPEFKNEIVSSGAVPRAVRCPLGDVLDTTADDLHNTTQRLRGLIERLAT
ncbi:hypothetical protein [Methylibium petroleiphilum]